MQVSRNRLRAAIFSLFLSISGLFGPSSPAIAQSWAIAPASTGKVVSEPQAQLAQGSQGLMQISVDATDLAHRVLNVRQRIPLARGGALRLHFARFLPGAHGPYGMITSLAGLRFEVGGQVLPWRRDLVDPFVFHIQVPNHASGAEKLVLLDLSFQHLSPMKAGRDRVSINHQQLGIEWENCLLAPADVPIAQLRAQMSLKLPSGWQAATSLRDSQGQQAAPDAAGWWRFGETSVEALVDSPLFAGRFFRRDSLGQEGSPVNLNLVADHPTWLNSNDSQLAAHRELVRQADALFGHRPFLRYDFLLALTDELGEMGLEHHESSENSVRSDYFRDWDLAIRARELLPHEYVHSWNGKFRRPADLWTPDYRQPMRTSQLWVYEGLTQYWGHVLAARSGLTTAEQARDRLGYISAEAFARTGRQWRSLADTQFDPTMGPGRSIDWEDYQRSADYYDEGLLVWLEVDMLIRELSGEQRSLDDFARSFFGSRHVKPNTKPGDVPVQVSTYTLDDVIAALNAIQPYSWANFFEQRLHVTGESTAPLEGLRRSGWALEWHNEESRFQKNERGWGGPSGTERPQDMAFSLGLRIAGDGKLEQVFWNSPAFQAGLAPGMVLLAVNDLAYKPERLAEAVAASAKGQGLRLLMRDGERFFTASLGWQGGLRYPRLVRLDGVTDRLGAVYATRAGATATR